MVRKNFRLIVVFNEDKNNKTTTMEFTKFTIVRHDPFLSHVVSPTCEKGHYFKPKTVLRYASYIFSPYMIK